MKKNFVLVSLGFISFYYISCTTGLARFKVPSDANEPTLKPNTEILISETRPPKRFDFICFNNEVENIGKFVAVFRLCGLGGDRIEIKKGDLFVNGKTADDDLDLLQLYTLPLSEFDRISNLINTDETVVNEKKDSVSLFLSTSFIKQHAVKATRVILPQNQKDEDIAKVFHQNWNPDHFGPVTVPPDYYFVLGDNRRHAADSRYLGFISKNKLVGTVILK